MRIALRCLLGVIVAAMTVWSAGAIYYSPLPDEMMRAALAGGFVLATSLAFILRRNRRLTLMRFLIAFAILVLFFFQIPASNDRDWQPEVSETPYATVNGDLLTIHGVRNFNYRTETDFDARWE